MRTSASSFERRMTVVEGQHLVDPRVCDPSDESMVICRVKAIYLSPCRKVSHGQVNDGYIER